MRGSGRGGEAQEFVWTGEGAGVRLETRGKSAVEPLTKSGPWALFRLLADANSVSGNRSVFDYYLTSQSVFGKQKAATGVQQGALQLHVEARAFPGLFGGALPMRCVPRIAQ